MAEITPYKQLIPKQYKIKVQQDNSNGNFLILIWRGKTVKHVDPSEEIQKMFAEMQSREIQGFIENHLKSNVLLHLFNLILYRKKDFI